jgi:hypothetical protein
MSVTAHISDNLGAASAFTVTSINVTAVSYTYLALLSHQLAAQLGSAAVVNESLYYNALLVAAGA